MTKKDLLLTLLEESVEKCYKHDFTLIERSMEQASVARIFFYMQEALKYDERFTLLSQYNLDSEYNKEGYSPKKTSRFKHGTRPDIILHNRFDQPQQSNLLILEFKPKLQSGAIDIPKRDKEKLEDFTHRECGFDYFLGVFIRLNEQKAEYRYFQNGCEVKKGDLHNG